MPRSRLRLILPATDLDDDDRPVGRFLSRREILVLFGAAGTATAVAACGPTGTSPSASATATATAAGTPGASATAGAVPSCVVVPELTEGPYYVDTDLERSDIRPDTTTGEAAAGTPLTLAFVVSILDGGTCVPLAEAVVDVWHCDALGVYSGVSGNSGNFLRGVQRTDANGAATITTIYPGWYTGRAVHIHFKVRTEPDADAGYELTSQLFFDDELSRQVYAAEPYSQKGAQDMTNDRDGIYQQSDGTTLLNAQPSGDGYAATFSIALQTT
ncbi:MAG TPA: intradiol ring-cleavage dioxygenase [Candidatus Limnocylindrales bacterium]|jgi:protocatechuate 3,4-dioxygenase beta subunit|nr:intradiol ring-cleavage dioxygenase [Candidatus Limnocylindrales bacterium]